MTGKRSPSSSFSSAEGNFSFPPTAAAPQAASFLLSEAGEGSEPPPAEGVTDDAKLPHDSLLLQQRLLPSPPSSCSSSLEEDEDKLFGDPAPPPPPSTSLEEGQEKAQTSKLNAGPSSPSRCQLLSTAHQTGPSPSLNSGGPSFFLNSRGDRADDIDLRNAEARRAEAGGEGGGVRRRSGAGGSTFSSPSSSPPPALFPRCPMVKLIVSPPPHEGSPSFSSPSGGHLVGSASNQKKKISDASKKAGLRFFHLSWLSLPQPSWILLTPRRCPPPPLFLPFLIPIDLLYPPIRL